MHISTHPHIKVNIHKLTCTSTFRYILYKYSSFAPNTSEWAFDTFHDGQVISYYLAAYYQSFLLIVGNYQVCEVNYHVAQKCGWR